MEVLLHAPLLALFSFTVIQLALWGVTLIGARAAADGAARDAAAYGATTQDATTSAQDRLRNIAGPLLRNPTITATRDPTTAQVTVSGTSSVLLPLPVTWTATVPAERFTTAGGGT